MRKQIVILIGCLPQPIVYKRVELAKEFGDVHLICWNRGNSMLLPPVEDGYSAHVIQIQAKNNPLKRLIPYYKFCTEADKILKEVHPDLIHVQGLDMLKIACAYKERASKPVRIVYEVADLHRLLVDRQKSLVAWEAQRYLRFIDRHLEQQYDLLVLTSMKYYDTYFQDFVAKEKVLYMPNVPDLSVFASYRKKEDGQFTIGYIGGIRYKKKLNCCLMQQKLAMYI